MRSLDIVFTGPRQTAVQYSEAPAPGPQQVLLKSLVSLISTGTESWCYRGEFDEGSGWATWVKYPFHPGYSMVAEVVEAGAEVTSLQVGDRVFYGGGHRQYATVLTSSVLLKLPATAAAEDAAWGALSFITQTGVRRGEPMFGGRSVVIGLGLLGQLAVQWLRAAGQQEVLAIDTAPMRLQMARAHGATQCFLGSAADAVPFVKEFTEDRLADVVFDVTGHYAVLPLALKLVRDYGTVVLLGDTPHPSKQVLTHDVLTRQLKIVGTHNAKLSGEAAFWTAERQVRLFLEFVRRGTVRVDDLITHRFSPEDPKHVYELLQAQRDQVMGVLFDWTGLPAG